jgi:hypothetical protein
MIEKEKKAYQIYITIDVMKKFKHVCLDEGINPSQFIEKLMLEHMKKKVKGSSISSSES